MTVECLKRLRIVKSGDAATKTFKYHKLKGEPFQRQPLMSLTYFSHDPVDLWHGLWYQGEIACLFGEPNVGKTLLAMQIANEIQKRGLNVIYFDFENASHQMKTRYKNDKLPLGDESDASFLVKSFNHNYYDAPHDACSILDQIMAEIIDEKAPVIIIDDINQILGSGRQEDVRKILNTLRSWAKMFLVSILVIAHSSRRKASQLTTINSMAGSFELSYFFDSIFSLTRANNYNASHNNITHYIKQHKNRIGEIIYDDMNVITACIGRDDVKGMLQFNNLYTGGNERQLLRDFGFHNEDQITQAIIRYKQQFFTTREIANMVGCSQSHVSKTLSKYKELISSQQTNVDNQNQNEGENTKTPSNEAPTLDNITSREKIKLEPDTSIIFVKPKYGFDIYGDPIYEKPDDWDDDY